MQDSNVKRWYAGVGSRSTPDSVLELMREFAFQAAYTYDWGLRSGAAPGADSAFEVGAVDAVGDCEIFLPWKGFAGHTSQLTTSLPNAHKIAAAIHPVWFKLKPAARELVARNMHQILGPNLDNPVKFVVCWTKDGCETIEDYSITTGGTGTAIACASARNIPVFNLKNRGRLEAAYAFMKGSV